MHDLAANAAYADRRKDLRRPTARRAELLAANNPNGVDCMILDESDGGVQVETAQALDLPEQIIIKFSPQSSQLVRRCLPELPADCLAQADRIQTSLAKLPHARLQLMHPGVNGSKAVQLFAIPQEVRVDFGAT